MQRRGAEGGAIISKRETLGEEGMDGQQYPKNRMVEICFSFGRDNKVVQKPLYFVIIDCTLGLTLQLLIF